MITDRDLDELVQALEAESRLIADRLRLARELRGTFGPSTLTPDHQCGHCERTFPSANGLAIHIGRSHPHEKRTFDAQAARDRAAAAA